MNPERYFCFLRPTNSNSNFFLPSGFVDDPNTLVVGNAGPVSNWFQQCELDKFKELGRVALYVDDTGSNTYEQYKNRMNYLELKLLAMGFQSTK